MTNVRWKKPVDGDFADAARWHGGVVPGPGDDAILNAAGGAFTVTSIADATVAGVRTAANATLDIDGGSFTVSAAINAGVIDVAGRQTALLAQGTIENTGAINLAGSHASLIVGTAGLTLNGAGQVSLGAGSTSTIFSGAGGVLTNAGNTITGAGRLGIGQTGLINGAKGVIDATGAANALIIDTGSDTAANAGLIETTGAAGMTLSATTLANSGTVEAAGSGALVLSAAEIADADAGVVLIRAYADASLRGSSITGGSLEIDASGVLTADSGTCALQVARFTIGNGGQLTIESGAFLEAQGTLRNSGAVLISGGGHTRLIVGEAGLEFTGGGALTLTDIANNEITGEAAADNLTNIDNTISGAGQIGGGQMTLVNAERGVIDADGAVNALIIDVGASTVVNAGRIEATGAAGGIVESAVSNAGLIEALGGRLTFNALVSGMGSAVISKATLDFESGFDQDVAFKSRGTLTLAQSQGYTASISGFSAAGKTTLDLRDIGFVGATEASFSGTSASGVLTVSDGTHTAKIMLVGDYLAATFTATDDGHGGTTVVASAAAEAAAPLRAFAAAMASLTHPAGEANHAREPGWGGRIALAAPRAVSA